MAYLNYSVTINAPKEKVWHTMLDLDTYKQWTGPFYPGSYYEGSWDKGSNIKFLAPDENGKLSGLYGRVVENVPYEYVSVEYVGQIVDGEVDSTSDEARTWIGAHENYRFTETDGITTVDVVLGSETLGDEFADMFEDSWPKSLNKLKEITEQH